MASRVPKEQEGVWLDVSRLMNIECCDCSLVHIFEFRKAKKGLIQFRCWRNNKATANKRRNTGIVIPQEQ